jgi:hypothetical protein
VAPIALRLRSPLQHIDLADRNLCDVFGENDPARRGAAIGEIFTEDCVLYDPMGGVYRPARSAASPIATPTDGR